MKIRVRVEDKTVEIDEGHSLLEAIRSSGIRITSPCGGKGTCGKCVIRIPNGTPTGDLTEAEMTLLDNEDRAQGHRLACQTFPGRDIDVEVPEESREITLELLLKHASINPIEEAALTTTVRSLTSSEKAGGMNMERGVIWLDEGRTAAITGEDGKKIAIALDIGSTTMVAYGFDILSQKIISAEAATNPQRQYGEDIMTRIDFAMRGPEQKRLLENVLRKGVSELIRKLAGRCGVSPSDVIRLTFVGNTAMHHFFLGLDVTRLGKVPFQPEKKGATEVSASEIGLAEMGGTKVNAPPLIAGYVGADLVAVLLATNLPASSRPTAAIDIGTNAEIALAIEGRVLACSAAAGPAFEGGNISYGMRATEGAICKVWSESGILKYETIGRSEPVGLCGSGLIDFVAEGLRLGLVDSAGGFVFENCGDKLLGKHGNARYLLYSNARKEVSVSQADIRQLQLGKAAIHTGLEIMAEKRSVASLDRLLLAGAFGANMSIRNGRFIGMLPEIPLNRIVPVGNAAGTGAIQLLSDTRARKRVSEIVRRTEHIELSSEKDFQKRFIAALDFPHQDTSEYPESAKSVKIKVDRRK